VCVFHFSSHFSFFHNSVFYVIPFMKWASCWKHMLFFPCVFFSPPGFWTASSHTYIPFLLLCQYHRNLFFLPFRCLKSIQTKGERSSRQERRLHKKKNYTALDTRGGYKSMCVLITRTMNGAWLYHHHLFLEHTLSMSIPRTLVPSSLFKLSIKSPRGVGALFSSASVINWCMWHYSYLQP